MSKKENRKRGEDTLSGAVDEENEQWGKMLKMENQNPEFNVAELVEADRIALLPKTVVDFRAKTPDRVEYTDQELARMREPIDTINLENMVNSEGLFVPIVEGKEEDNPFIYSNKVPGNLGSEMEEDHHEWFNKQFPEEKEKGGKKRKSMRKSMRKSKRNHKTMQRKTNRKTNRKMNRKMKKSHRK